jgi:hypothetical protein
MSKYLELGNGDDRKEQELRARELKLREQALELSEKVLNQLSVNLTNSERCANYSLAYAALNESLSYPYAARVVKG